MGKIIAKPTITEQTQKQMCAPGNGMEEKESDKELIEIEVSISGTNSNGVDNNNSDID